MKVKYKLLLVSVGLFAVCWTAYLFWFTNQVTFAWTQLSMIELTAVGLSCLLAAGILLLLSYGATEKDHLSTGTEDSELRAICILLGIFYVITPVLQYIIAGTFSYSLT